MGARSASEPRGPITITPFTADGGSKASPQLSPDGERVAYVWDGAGLDNPDIYVKARGPGTRPLRLTEHPASDQYPAWSPDGRQIAFVRTADDRASIHSVPSLGGQERKLVDVRGPATLGAYFVPVLSWAPDGSPCLCRGGLADGRARIFGCRSTPWRRPAHLATRGLVRRLQPRASPDGRHSPSCARARGVGQPGRLGPARAGRGRRVTSGRYGACRA
jgi:dipeptidyl aminopeptidase/acylaminoacyl peptidase